MNKYSKRALKTTATVGMSLAMVLSGVAAPLTNVMAATVCKTEDLNKAADLIYAIKADLKANATSKKLSTVSIDEVITWTNADAIVDDITGASFTGTTLTAILEATGVKELLESLADCKDDADAKTLVGHKDDSSRKTIIEKVTAIEKAIAFLEDQYADDADLDGVDLSKDDYKIVIKEYNALDSFYSTYKDNMKEANKVGNKEIYSDLFYKMESAVQDYEDSYIGDFVDSYVKALKGLEVIDGVTVADLVDKDVTFLHTNLTDLEDFIKDLKADDISDMDGEVKYAKMENEEDVLAYVDRLEEMVEEIKEVKVLLKSTNSLVKDYKKIETKVAALAKATDEYNEDKDATVIAYEKAYNAFRSEDVEALAAYVDEIVNEFYTVEVITRTNGNFSLRFEDAAYARYVTETEVVKANLKTLLITNLVKDEEESVYLTLAGNTSNVEKLIKACTTDIEGITLGTKLTDKDAAKIVAARKAYNLLIPTADSEYKLTAKEERAVKANAELIDALYTKLIFSGMIVTTGWVDKGNGDWDFLNEDGTKPTKWVAAGTNWYYVKSGTMLRNSWIANDATGSKWYYVDDAGKMVFNTTLNGYTFDANGVWVK